MEAATIENMDISNTIKAPIEEKGAPQSLNAQAPAQAPETDHQLITLFDIGIKQSVEYCSKANLPAPNTALWDNFSRPFLNTAFHYYIPDSATPENPLICLVLGIGGIGLMYLPVYRAYNAQQAPVKKKDSKIKPLTEFDEKPANQESPGPDQQPSPAPQTTKAQDKKISVSIEPLNPELIKNLKYEDMPGF